MKQYIGDGMLFLTAVIWGSGFVVTAIALQYFSAYEVMAGRFVLATIILSLVFGYKFKHFTRSVLWKGGIIGLFLYIGFLLQTVGLQYTTPSKNAFLTAVNVVIVPLVAYLMYKRKIDTFEISGSLLAVIGIWFLTMQQNMTMNIGDLLSLACAFAFAFDIFYTNHFVKNEDPIALTIVQFITASLLSIAMVIGQGEATATFSKEGIYSILYLGIFSTTIAYLFQNIGHKYTTATKAAIILSTESLFGMLFSILFLQELLTGRLIVGAIFIMAAILLTEGKSIFRKEM